LEKSEPYKAPHEVAPSSAEGDTDGGAVSRGPRLAIPTRTYSARDRLRWFKHRLAATALATEVLPGVGARLRGYAQLTRLDRPIGIWLLMWPVLWALWLSSEGRPDPHVFVVFVLGVVLTRSAGCAMNDFADRNFDRHVARTRNRPLVTGQVDPVEALALCAGLGLIALGFAMTLNRLTQLLTVIGAVLVVSYPFMKRFFPIPQFYLGIAFTWSVPMTFAAHSGTMPPRLAWVLFLAGVLWTMAYDTMYAMVDRDDDRKLGLHTSALFFGRFDVAVVMLCHAGFLAGMAWVGHFWQAGSLYYAGLVAALACALWQFFLIRTRERDRCFRAFLSNHWFGLAVFAGVAADFAVRAGAWPNTL
jgi:4-hydroxybenzoate polyprenyltransferase